MKIIKNILTKFRWQNNRILTLSVHLLLWIASVTLFYVLLSIFVDMPAESELRNTNNKLNSEYNKMSERYEELTEVIDNVVARDENVFRKLFESNPYDLTIDDDEERIALHESLMDLDNDELLSELNNKLQSAENDKDALDLFSEYGVGAIVSGVVPSWWGGKTENAGKMHELNNLKLYGFLHIYVFFLLL